MDTARRAVVNRALALLDDASPADLAGYLAQTDIHAHLQADPPALRRALADPTVPSFAAYKAAQQILRAAGQPY